MAVLVRAGYMSADLEIELTNRKIPFEKWGGIKFLEAAHVKDVLAFLRVFENPRDEVSWYRILMLLPGIGDVTARAMMETMAERAWDPEAFAHFDAAARARATRTRARGAAPSPAQRALERRGQRRRRHRRDPHALRSSSRRTLRSRRAAARRISISCASSPRATRTAAPSSPRSRSSRRRARRISSTGSESEDDALVISTVHSAKGKEWDAVFVIWAVDGWFPSSRSLDDDEQLEEERRLMYVAMTRARNHLAVTYPLNVYATRRGAGLLDRSALAVHRSGRARRRCSASCRRTRRRQCSAVAERESAAAAARAGDRPAGACCRGRFARLTAIGLAASRGVADLARMAAARVTVERARC